MNRIVFSILLGLAAINISRADFVQLPGHFGGFTCDPTIRVAENFEFAQSSTISSLTWWGGYYNPPPGLDSFTVQLYADTGGQPGGLLSGFNIGAINKMATGDFVNPGLYPEYKYSADLQTPFVAQAGTTYWLSITYSATQVWLWEDSTRTDINSGVQRSFNGGAWQPYYDRTALQLVVVPEPSSALLLAGALVMLLVKRHRAAALHNLAESVAPPKAH